ncbi:MAG: hypothetical protein IT547_15260 [Hyphomonadaceae bacterium]|nr:hypothetical protein [Hyphomonadaceae bacterium]
MLIPHFEERCVSCLRTPPFQGRTGLAKEHVIPRALGGILHCEFLCPKCNAQYGHTFERKTRRDPAIRRAIWGLRNELPHLYRKIEKGQPKIIGINGDESPDLSKAETLTPLISLKIAYEFECLSFGRSMLANDNPALREIRRTLIQGDTSAPVFRVQEMIAKDRTPRPFHGIAFEGNDPHAVIQVRLFGYLAYRVHFPNLAIEKEPFGYTHTLDDAKEWVSPKDQEAA